MKHRRSQGENTPSSASRPKAGFTLIELLVVIAIIAILAAILFPVFAQARGKARQAACMSNMKQIGLAVIQYQQDYDETFPMGESQNWDTPWIRTVQPYVKSVQVFRCPDDPAPTAPGMYSDAYFGTRVSYVSNGLLIKNASGVEDLHGVMGMVQPKVPSNPNGWMAGSLTMTNAAVQAPADTVMVAEQNFVWPRANQDPGNLSDWGPGCLISGLDYWGGYAPDKIPDGSRAATANPYDPNGRNGGVMAVHNTKANFLFADGHVKALDPVATNPQLAADTQQQKNAKNMWDATRQQ